MKIRNAQQGFVGKLPEDLFLHQQGGYSYGDHHVKADLLLP